MKVLYPVLFILISSITLFGQSQESFVLGGNFSFSVGDDSSEQSDGYWRSTSFSPYVGKVIGNTLIIGLSGEFQKRIDDTIFEYEEENSFKSNYKSFGLGLFLRYTLRPDKDFSFFVQPYGLISQFKDELDSNLLNGDHLNEGFKYSIGTDIGFKYDFNNNFRATFNLGGIGYSRSIIENINLLDETKNDFSISLGSVFPRIGIELKL